MDRETGAPPVREYRSIDQVRSWRSAIQFFGIEGDLIKKAFRADAVVPRKERGRRGRSEDPCSERGWAGAVDAGHDLNCRLAMHAVSLRATRRKICCQVSKLCDARSSLDRPPDLASASTLLPPRGGSDCRTGIGHREPGAPRSAHGVTNRGLSMRSRGRASSLPRPKGGPAPASPLRSGDELAGLAARSDAARVAARTVLADLPLKSSPHEGRGSLRGRRGDAPHHRQPRRCGLRSGLPF